MSRQCHVDMHLSCTSCPGPVCGGASPTHPRRLLLHNMANVTLSFLSWPWLKDMWHRVKQEAENLRSEKFFTFKCKEGDYINLNLGVECHVNAAFSDPGSWHDHWLWVTRNESMLRGEKREDWWWINNRINEHQVWALKGRGQSFFLQLVDDSLDVSNNLSTHPNPAAVAPGSPQKLPTCQVPGFLPRTCLPIISLLRDL